MYHFEYSFISYGFFLRSLDPSISACKVSCLSYFSIVSVGGEGRPQYLKHFSICGFDWVTRRARVEGQ